MQKRDVPDILAWEHYTNSLFQAQFLTLLPLELVRKLLLLIYLMLAIVGKSLG
jgi:hypothetical protein